jgi:DNA-binding MarR family transcriptional regulator
MTDFHAKPAERVVQLIDRLARLTRELQFCSGLNPAQWEALRFVSRANRYSCTPSGLAEFLGTTKGTASQTLIALESKGFLQRVRSTEDRRQVALALTPAGTALLAADPMTEIAEVTAEMEADRSTGLVRGLSELLHRLQKRHGIAEFGVCENCTLFCVEQQAEAVAKCGHTGENIAADEAGKLCVNYRRPEPAASAP